VPELSHVAPVSVKLESSRFRLTCMVPPVLIASMSLARSVRVTLLMVAPTSSGDDRSKLSKLRRLPAPDASSPTSSTLVSVLLPVLSERMKLSAFGVSVRTAAESGPADKAARAEKARGRREETFMMREDEVAASLRATRSGVKASGAIEGTTPWRGAAGVVGRRRALLLICYCNRQGAWIPNHPISVRAKPRWCRCGRWPRRPGCRG